MDAPARSWIHNITAHNSKYGSNWCFIQTETCQEDKSPRYPYKDYINLRDHQVMAKYSSSANEKEPIYGTKGPSLLCSIPNFDYIADITLECIHTVILGVFRNFVRYGFLNPSYKELPFYVGNKLKHINDRFKNIKVPSNFLREPRNLNFINNWKSSEFETTCQMFFPYLFKGILPNNYFNSFCKLLAAIEKLPIIPVTEVNVLFAEKEIESFMQDIYFKKFYPRNFWRYNLHCLTHLPDAVRRFGPASSNPAYLYEHDLGKMKSLLKSPYNVGQQILNKHLIKLNFDKRLINNTLPISDEFIDIIPITQETAGASLQVAIPSKLIPLFSLGLAETRLVNSFRLDQSQILSYKRLMFKNFELNIDDNQKNCNAYFEANGFFYHSRYILSDRNVVLLIANPITLKAEMVLGFRDGNLNYKLDNIFIVNQIRDVFAQINLESATNRVIFLPKYDAKGASVNDLIVIPNLRHIT